MKKTSSILSATGSVGQNAVDVARKSSLNVDFISLSVDVFIYSYSSVFSSAIFVTSVFLILDFCLQSAFLRLSIIYSLHL